MKDKIIKIAESIWAFFQAVGALICLAFIASIILFLDFLFLGGVIFG